MKATSGHLTLPTMRRDIAASQQRKRRSEGEREIEEYMRAADGQYEVIGRVLGVLG